MKVVKQRDPAGNRLGVIQRWVAGCCLIAAVYTMSSAAAMAGAVVKSSETKEPEFVSFSVTGVVNSNSDNQFGLKAGDTIVLAGKYDRKDYNGVGRRIVYFDSTTDNTLTLQLGSYVVDQTFDSDYYSYEKSDPPGKRYPRVTFFNGQFAGAEFAISKGINGATFDLNFYVGGLDEADEGSPSLSAIFNFATSPAPEPSSFLLLGTAAVGLSLMHARRRVGKSRG